MAWHAEGMLTHARARLCGRVAAVRARVNTWRVQAAGIAVSDAGATAAGAAPLENLEWDVEMLRTVPSAEEVREAHRAVLPGSVKISSRYYFTSTPAKVVVNRELRKAGEGSTRHLEIDIRGLSLTYTSADNLGVCPENDPEAVEALGRWMGYDLDAWFTLRRTDTEEGRAAKPLFPTPCTVREALSRYCDFNGTVRKDFLGQLANFATKDADKERLVHLASSGGKEAFREEIHNPKLSMFEVFEVRSGCTGRVACSGVGPHRRACATACRNSGLAACRLHACCRCCRACNLGCTQSARPTRSTPAASTQ